MTAPTSSALYSGSVGINGYALCVWVCGTSGNVFKCNPWNFPINWRTVNFGIPSTVTLVSMSALDSLLAIAAGYIGTTTYVYRTSNGGYNWTQVFTQTNGYINGVWLKDASTGIFIGNPIGGRWQIRKTTNGGVSWDSAGRYLPQNGAEAGFNNSIYCKGDSIWFGTNNYRIYYSSNYGTNWTAQPTGTMQNVYSIYFNEPGFGYDYGFSGGSTLLQTTNWGLNWTEVSNVQGTGNIVGISSSNPGVSPITPPFWYARSSTIYPLQGWGLNPYTAPSGTYTYMFRYFRGGFPVNSQNFATRNNGGISWCGCVFGGIKKTNNQIPDQFQLYQNYPNPFNPKSLIRFDISTASSVILKVFDITGKEIITLVDEQLKPGAYEAEFDGTNLTSGIYYYRLIAGDFVETMKMALIK